MPARPERAIGGDRIGVHPHLRGHRVTDVAALAGAVVWVALVVAAVEGPVALGEVELFVAFAQLALVPLGLGLVPLGHRTDPPVPYRAAVWGQFPAAILAVLGLTRPVGSTASIALVLPWLGATAAIGSVGLERILSRGFRPVLALAVDAALLYLPVGAVALVLHRAGISLGFQPIIVLLTAVHYHYAGFVLPLVTGLAGDRLTDDDGRFGADLPGRIALGATLVVIVNLALIAVGITFSPTVEIVAVTLFTLAVAGFAAVVLKSVVPALPRLPGALLAVAALSLFVTMALAVAYGYSAFPETGVLITIGEMVRWHGTLNAFGFAVPALLAFRLLGPPGVPGE